MDSISLWKSTQLSRNLSPVKYIKDNFEDLHSYKIVNTVCKENLLKVIDFDDTDKKNESVDRPVTRGHSPLANLIIPEHLTKIDNYLQESLNVLKSEKECSVAEEILNKYEVENTCQLQNNYEEALDSHQKIDNIAYKKENISNYNDGEIANAKDKLNSVKTKHPGVLKTVYNWPMHYHAAIMCFFLIVYNLIYQYLKQYYHGKKESVN